jgi:hypothetical protein
MMSFYTPRLVVKLLVEMIEPFQGRVYDPCCGSSGMFVQSEEFIRARANLRRMVRHVLRKYGYPPDKQEAATQTVPQQAEQLGFEFAIAQEEPEEVALPFKIIPEEDARPGENCVPLYDLAVAAGAFSSAQTPEGIEWVVPNGRKPPAPDLFVARVEGESMNRRIPHGAYLLHVTLSGGRHATGKGRAGPAQRNL